MPPARKGSQPGDGTCDVCFKTSVLTSVCEATGKAYCRGVYACRRDAGVNVKGTGTGTKKRKRPRDGGAAGTGGADGGDGGGGAQMERKLTLKKPYQIVGHRLCNQCVPFTGIIPVFGLF